MLSDRLSIPAVSRDPLQPARSSVPAQAEEASFASLYAEALQSAEQTISELSSVDEDAGGDSGSDDLLGFLDLQAGCFPGGPATALEAGLAARAYGAPGQQLDLGREFSLAPASSAVAPETGLAPSGMDRLIGWLDTHAQLHSTHRCASSVRQAMEAAGIPTADRPASGDAGDYGPFLLRHGAQVVPSENYQPRAGDIAVFDKSLDHPNGHVQVYDGQQWVSDFLQHTFSPYRDQQSTPPVTIYRMS